MITSARRGAAFALMLAALACAPASAEAQVFKKGSFTKSTATAGCPASCANVVAHGLGETPKALILWTTGNLNEAFGPSFVFGFGVSDGPGSSRSVGASSADAGGTSNTSRRMATKALTLMNFAHTSGPLSEAVLQSWDATNFELQWSPNNNQAYVIHFIAIGGDGVSAKVVDWQMPTAPNPAFPVNTVGFRPDVVLHAHAGDPFTGAFDTNGQDAIVGLGVMSAAGDQWANSFFSDDGSGSGDTQRGQQTDACIFAFTDVLGVTKEASFVSMDSNGFTVNFSTANANAGRVFSLALQGIRVKAGSFNKTTAAAPATDTISGLGFQPGIVLLSSFQDLARATPVGHSRFGIGASDGTNEGASALQDEDGPTNMAVDSIDKTSKVFVKVDNNTATIDAEADLAGLFDGSFTLGWTTNDAVATQIVYLALGPLKPFRFRKSITVDRTKVPSGCGATFANFPMLYSVTDLDLRTTANGGDVTDAEGDDIIFRALDDATCGGAGTAPCTLDHEIESYNATTGQLVAWVRIPSLNTAATSSDTVIHIYYGNPDITTSIQNADGVWDANYVAVWHLKEEAAGTGTLGLYKDSSGNGNHGDDLISATGQTGQINGGHDFDGVDDRARAPSSASLLNLGPLTLSAWIRPDAFTSRQILAKTTTNTVDPGYWRLELDNTAPEVSTFAFAKDSGATDVDVNAANNSIVVGVWQQVAATWDGTQNVSGVHLYRNGSETAYGATTNGSAAPVADGGLTLAIGANGDGTTAVDGLLDEVRISNIVRSACWIATEYNNTNAPGDVSTPNFYRVGVELTDLAQADSDAKVLSGSYLGNDAVGRAIEVGFVPDFVIVKGNTAQVGVFRTSTMTGDSSKETFGSTALNSNWIQSIDSGGVGGFSVGSDARVNAGGVMYYWTAFKAGSGKMVVGSYTGNGSAAPPPVTGPYINSLGFSADVVFVMPAPAASAAGYDAIHRSAAPNVTGAFTFFDSGPLANTITLGANGFTVGTDTRVNNSGTVYHWVAWNEVAGYLDVGNYTGDAQPTRDLTGVGFEPEVVMQKRVDNGGHTHLRPASLAGSTGNSTLELNASAAIPDRIKQLLPDGFQLHQQWNTNTAGPPAGEYFYYAWKRSSYPYVISGSYTGNAPAAHPITDVGFGPDVVIVKGNTAQTAVIKTSTMSGMLAKPMAGATGLVNNLITLDAAGFTVGASGTTDARVNADPTAYYWIAFKASPSTMKVGTYVGTGLSSPAKTITGLGFSPELVFVMAETGNPGNEAVHRSSASTETHTFDSTTGPANNWITSLDADGFTVATTSARTNSAGVTYHYVAWNEIPGQMDVGNYVGNGADNRSITGIGFEPEYVLVRRYGANSGGIFGTHHPASLGRSNDEVLWFHASANTNPGNRIQALQSDGFQVGNQVVVNELDDSLGGAVNAEYMYYAWKQFHATSLTAVRLISLAATRYDRGVLLEWRTGFEIDNLGFHVYREVNGERTRVTRSLVTGSGLMAGQGTAVNAEQRYAYWDLDSASADRSAVYWLEDLDFNGTSTWHGPVTPVDGGLQPPDVSSSDALNDLAKRSKRRGKLFLAEGARLERLRKHGPRDAASTALETQWALAGGAAVKIGISRPGWYRVAQPDLLAAGLDPQVDPRTLRLFIEGVEQAMSVTGEADGRFDPIDAIEFYGTGADTPSADTRVYWLTAGRHGRRVATQGPVARGAEATTPGSFAFTLQQKERSIYFAALRNGDDENWFGSLVYEEPTDLSLNVANVDATAGAELEVALQGVTAMPDVDPDHRVAVLVNGAEVGELIFDGQAKGIQTVAIPPGTLGEGANMVTMVARGGEADYSLVDVVRLRYGHAYRADADLLRFTADGPGTVTVGGFASRAIRVVDISDPLSAEELRGAVGADGSLWAVTVKVPESGSRTLLAFTEATVAAPAFVRANRPSRWHAAANAAEYVAVSHAEFADWVAPLVTRRKQQGLSTARIDVEDLYDEFSFGEKTPEALKDFVRHARSRWSQPPRFLMLVGDATVDPRDYAGFGDADFVPTQQVPMAQVSLETASDDWFVDLNDDGLPELAVGRLSVRTGAQAERMAAKILAYEENVGAFWTKNVLLVADRNDSSSDFEASTAALRSLVPSRYDVQQVFSGAAGADVARRALLDAVNAGQLIVNYTGHGSVRVWGSEATLLTAEEVAGELYNRARLPLVVSMNCLNGFFHGIYGEESLAETFLRAPNGGAVAAWASSGVTESTVQARVNQEFFRLIFTQPGLTLGEAIAAAKRAVTDRDVRRSWVFFGDPAMRLLGVAQVTQTPTDTADAQPPATAGGVSDSESDAGGEDSSSMEPASAEPVRLADFNADGRDDVLLYEAETGRWSLVLNERGGERVTEGAWLPRAQVVPARLNADRFVDLLLYVADTGEWVQALNNGDGTFRTSSGVWATGWQVRVANFAGDTRDEVFLYQPLSGDWFEAASDGKGGFSYRNGRARAGSELSIADFNRDSLADLFIGDRASGSGWVAVNDGSGGFSAGTEQWLSNWPAGATSLAGKAVDLVLYDSRSGVWAERQAKANQSSFRSGAWSPDLATAAADLSGDGADDLLLYDPGTGAWSVLTNTSSGLLASQSGAWRPGLSIATGDLDGDGRADVLLYDRSDRTWSRCSGAKSATLICGESGAWDRPWSLVGYRR